MEIQKMRDMWKNSGGVRWEWMKRGEDPKEHLCMTHKDPFPNQSGTSFPLLFFLLYIYFIPGVNPLLPVT